MEREKFEEIMRKIGYQRDKWYIFHEISSILTSSGKGFYPNWKHMRFKISKDKILVKHGTSRPYGARLNGLMYVSGDYSSLTFSAGKDGIALEDSSFYGEGFRQPKVGDAVRITEGLGKTIGESFIKDIKGSLNSIVVFLWAPIIINKSNRISFYDPLVFSADKENCVHSTMQEGIYMQFSGNKSKKEFHEEIKIKDIKEVNLKVGSDYFNKTYKLE
jgi:hypothetical protein